MKSNSIIHNTQGCQGFYSCSNAETRPKNIEDMTKIGLIRDKGYNGMFITLVPKVF